MSYQNANFCTGCGQTLQAGWNVCPRCGTAVGAVPVQSLGLPASPDFGYCAYHPHTPAVYTCDECRKPICNDCSRISAKGRGYITVDRKCRKCDDSSRSNRAIIGACIGGIMLVIIVVVVIVILTQQHDDTSNYNAPSFNFTTSGDDSTSWSSTTLDPQQQ